MDLLGIALVAVLLVIAARALYARRPTAREKQHMRSLVHACHGDTALAERLVISELDRAPSINLTAAAQRARKRLMRDRQR